MSDLRNCPKCGEECDRQSVDVGIGIIYGPWGCSNCGWSEHPEYDSSEGESPAQKANPDRVVDQWGCLHTKSYLDAGISRGIGSEHWNGEDFKK